MSSFDIVPWVSRGRNIFFIGLVLVFLVIFGALLARRLGYGTEKKQAGQTQSEVVENVLVKKDEVRAFRRNRIKGMDDVPLVYRIDYVGAWIERPVGKKWNLPRESNILELKSHVKDFVVQEIK